MKKRTIVKCEVLKMLGYRRNDGVYHEIPIHDPSAKSCFLVRVSGSRYSLEFYTNGKEGWWSFGRIYRVGPPARVLREARRVIRRYMREVMED
jgi:hypothetical protein